MNKQEIIYHLVNSGIAGLLVLGGAVAAGGITKEGFIAALGASMVVFLTKFKECWVNKNSKLTLFSFI